MKHLSRVLAAAIVAISLPSAGIADVIDVEASTLSLSIGTLPPIEVPSNPSQSIAVSSGSGTFTEPPGIFGPTTVQLPRALFTGVSLISGLTIVGLANGTQPCTQFDPALACTGGLAGTTLVNVLNLFDLSIPLSVVGSPGATVMAGTGGITITVTGQKWTAGVASVTGVTVDPGTQPTGTAFLTGTDARTAMHGGQLVLVSGFRSITNVGLTLPGFAVQTLNFAPEPTRVLLSAAAMGALGLLVRARSRRR
jgi:hypothetical protein